MNYLERYADEPIRDFKPATGMSVVYMYDGGGFSIEASPGYLVFDKSDGYGIEVIAAVLGQDGMPNIPCENVAVYPEDKARRLFDGARWSFYLAGDPDNIEVGVSCDGRLSVIVDWKVFVSKASGDTEAWELECFEEALPVAIQNELDRLREDAIERYQMHCDVKELTGTVEA